MSDYYDITIEGRGGHDGPSGGHYGNWARVWCSRHGVVTATIIEEWHDYMPGRLARHQDCVRVRVTLTDQFDHQNDYLVVEHKCSPNPLIDSDSRREHYQLLAGVMPAWADFPARWREWVYRHECEACDWLAAYVASQLEDAVRTARLKVKGARSQEEQLAAWHDVARLSELQDAIRFARRKASKGNRISAWCAVAELAGIDPDSICGTGSWTAVRAMPVRIAMRLGWRPSEPKPRYQRPESSGRVLVAAPNHLPAPAETSP